MTKFNTIAEKKLILTIIGMFVLVLSTSAQVKTVQYLAIDKIPVTADLYAPKPATATMVILMHQANYSRGEYIEIAPQLNELGFNCLAVDLRSGGEVNGIVNETWKYADSLKKETRFTDAYVDIIASVNYVKKYYPGAKIILFGSSYSASLALKFAGDYPAGIAGVVAFSPADNFSKFGWARNLIQTTSAKIKCPVFISSIASEEDSWRLIYDAIPGTSKSKYVPSEGGKHGAKTLWNIFPESKGYWAALKTFLTRLK